MSGTFQNEGVIEVYKKGTGGEKLAGAVFTATNQARPIEDNTKGTVMFVDDMGTIHCDFDNGRSLGVVPGEDSFRKLTAEELAEEQEMMRFHTL